MPQGLLLKANGFDGSLHHEVSVVSAEIGAKFTWAGESLRPPALHL